MDVKAGNLLNNRFSFLGNELLMEIRESAVVRSLAEGKCFLEEGDYIKSFPLVLDGCLRVIRLNDEGNELLLYYLNPGEVCSMTLTCCMSLQKSNIKIVAETDSVVLSVPVEKLDKWVSDYKQWKEFMMFSYRNKFEELLKTIDSIAFTSLDKRLERFFEERFEVTGKTVFIGTHQDIAIQLNTSREVISRLLSHLEKSGKIITSRNRIDYSGLIKK
jgi:CRP/FNR family transcriptional regulator, anaerobic regulatory protein